MKDVSSLLIEPIHTFILMSCRILCLSVIIILRYNCNLLNISTTLKWLSQHGAFWCFWLVLIINDYKIKVLNIKSLEMNTVRQIHHLYFSDNSFHFAVEICYQF